MLCCAVLCCAHTDCPTSVTGGSLLSLYQGWEPVQGCPRQTSRAFKLQALAPPPPAPYLQAAVHDYMRGQAVTAGLVGPLTAVELDLLAELAAYGDGGPFLDKVVAPVFGYLAVQVDKLGSQGTEPARRVTYDDCNESLCCKEVVHAVRWAGCRRLGGCAGPRLCGAWIAHWSNLHAELPCALAACPSCMCRLHAPPMRSPLPRSPLPASLLHTTVAHALPRMAGAGQAGRGAGRRDGASGVQGGPLRCAAAAGGGKWHSLLLTLPVLLMSGGEGRSCQRWHVLSCSRCCPCWPSPSCPCTHLSACL